MKKIKNLLVSSLVAFSLLSPFPVFADRQEAKKEISWYVDERFDNFYNYIEKNKVDSVDAVKEAFKTHNIVCVGEVHDESHREFAVKYLKDLKGVVDYFGVEVSTDYNGKDGRIDYEKYAKDFKNASNGITELTMIKAAIDAGLEVVCLDEPLQSNACKKPRDETIKDNIKKFKDKKMLVWYGSHHVSKYDRGLEGTPFLRRLVDENIKPYSVLLLTPTNSERLSKTILFYSKLRNESFMLKDLDKVPEEVYNYNMQVKEIFMCFDAFIYYVPENMKVLKDNF
ncbi:MAG: hypothetical protein Q8O03_00580 [Nanoarchaeota archaeon]|nr:hypothetical protein [Nanoarchaeota archaeon]